MVCIASISGFVLTAYFADSERIFGTCLTTDVRYVLVTTLTP